MWRVSMMAVLLAACGGDEGSKVDAALPADAGPLADAMAAPDARVVDPGNALSITPAATDFGIRFVNQLSANVTFTVASTAPTGPVAVVVNSGDFNIVSNGCSAGLAAGATCAVVANMGPTRVGVLTATLTVSADPGGSAMATLRGTACSTAPLTMTPNLHDFGAVAAGQSSAPVSFTVDNPGCFATGVSSVFVGGSDASSFMLASNGCTAPLAPMVGSCTLSVDFAPTTAGIKTATLTAAISSGGTASATLNGTATP